MERVTMDLNADVGEGFESDARLVPLVSSVNIACGAHAGDEATMREAVRLAFGHGVAIGAHPGFPDREHFGRRELAVSPEEAGRMVIDQMRLLAGIAGAEGARVGHVKLHGALYNMAARDPLLADGVVRALLGHPEITLVALAGSVLEAKARQSGLSVAAEGFADRLYRPDGSLAPRTQAGSVLSDAGAAAAQALLISRESAVIADDGSRVRVAADTLCLHGDSPGAVAFAVEIRRVLLDAGVRVMHLGRPPG